MQLVFLLAVFLCRAVVRAGSVINDNSLGSAAVLHGGNIFTITPASGKQVGQNLFHSLSTFNLTQGETAAFTGPNSVANVITRVTGGPSSIDGTIQCTIPGANFYLVNPAGVVFGPNAALDIRGSFAVTTADQVKLADGAVFGAPGPADATLTTASPVEYGFLKPGPPSAISVSSSTLTVNPAMGISIVGGNITLAGPGGALFAPDGTIQLTSLSGPQMAPVAPATVSSTPPAGGGRIVLSSTFVVATDGLAATGPGSGGGRMVISAGSFLMQSTNAGAPVLSADVGGNENGVGISISARSIVLANIPSVLPANGPLIDTTTRGSGNGGAIDLICGNLSLTGGSIRADTLAAGNGGPITITVKGNADLRDGSIISAGSGGPAGAAGKGGNIILAANSLTLRNQAVVNALTLGNGSGGSVAITVPGTITLDGSAGTVGFSAGTNGDKPAGMVTVMAGALDMSGNAIIDDGTSGAGAGGAIQVLSRGTIVLNKGATIESNSISAGPAGSVTVVSTRAKVIVKNQSSISVQAVDPQARVLGDLAAGGDLTIQAAGGIDLLNDSIISSRATGNGGNISLLAPPGAAINISHSQITGQAGFPFFPMQNGGNIIILDPSVVALNAGTINGLASGREVLVFIAADALLKSADSQILTNRQAFTVDTNVTSGLQRLPPAALGGQIQLNPACFQMIGVDASSFVQTGNGGLPPNPGGFLMQMPP